MTKALVENSRKRKGEALSTPQIAKKHVRQKYDLDIDTLECPICSEPFSPPVYQCENGHAACSACCEKITKGCLSCSQPFGRIRNIAIEKVIESLQVDCKHARHGCNIMVKYTERDEHEKNLCEYRTIRCPVFDPDCSHKGPKDTIPRHLAQEHRMQIVDCSGSTRSASFRMKISDGDVLIKAKETWLLVCWVESNQGDAFHCNSFGALKEVVYKLTVKPVKLNRESTKVYSMQDVAHDVAGEWTKDYLLVPGKSHEFELTVSLD